MRLEVYTQSFADVVSGSTEEKWQKGPLSDACRTPPWPVPGRCFVTVSMPLLSDTRQRNCRGISVEFLFSCLLCEPYTLLRINYSYLNNWADWFTWCKLCVLGIFIYLSMGFSFDPVAICTAIILIIVLLTVLATVLSSLSTLTHRGLHSPQGREQSHTEMMTGRAAQLNFTLRKKSSLNL